MKTNMDSLLCKTNKETDNHTHERIFFCLYELNSSSCDLSVVVFALYSHIWHETQVTYCYLSHTQHNKVKIYHSFEPLVKSLRDVLKKCHHQGVGPIIPSTTLKSPVSGVLQVTNMSDSIRKSDNHTPNFFFDPWSEWHTPKWHQHYGNHI